MNNCGSMLRVYSRYPGSIREWLLDVYVACFAAHVAARYARMWVMYRRLFFRRLGRTSQLKGYAAYHDDLARTKLLKREKKIA
jgi:hypothetical protein